MSPIKYELFVGPGGVYCQSHCECGSTMSSGDYLPTANAALEACQDGMIEHKAMHIKQMVAARKQVQR